VKTTQKQAMADRICENNTVASDGRQSSENNTEARDGRQQL
jgi:hypothetical protein